MFVNERTLTVEWGDCDPAGIVFYPRYFAMFDTTTGALFAVATGMTKYEMLQHYGIVGIPMVDTGAKFIVPSRYGDVIRIQTQVTALRRSSFNVSHTVFREDTLAIEATETRVWAARHPDDPERLKGMPIPDDLAMRLQNGPQLRAE